MRCFNKRQIFNFILFIILILYSSKAPIFAQETMESIINKQMDKLDVSQTEEVLNKVKTDENPYLNKFDIKKAMVDSIRGEGAVTPMAMLKGVLNLMFGEVNIYLNLMGRLIVLGIFCTILSTLGASFESKSTSQVAFYVCYIVLILALAQSFRISMNIVYEVIDQMVLAMQASIPVMVTLLISTGSVASGSIFQPILITSIQLSTAIIKNAVLPMVFFVSILQIINNISEDFKIDSFIELAYTGIKWSLTGIVTVFVGIMGLHGLTTPFVDGTFNKAAKSMTSAFVPVVGEALSGTVDLVMNCGVIVKNSYTVAIIILLLLVCAIPVIKIFLCMVTYKLSAAIIEPISDKRIANAMSEMSRATGYLLGTLATVVVLFILNMLILVGVSNITSMMR